MMRLTLFLCSYLVVSSFNPISLEKPKMSALPEVIPVATIQKDTSEKIRCAKEDARQRKWHEVNQTTYSTLSILEKLAAFKNEMVFPTGRSVTPIFKRLKRDYLAYRGHELLINKAMRTGFLTFVATEIEKRGLPIGLVYIPFAESSLNPAVDTSSAGAYKYWQLIESTARLQGLRVDSLVDERRDSILETRAALDYFVVISDTIRGWERQYNITLTDENFFCLLVASYNCGMGNVKKLFLKTKGCFDSFHYLKKSEEIREYALKILALVELIGTYIEEEYLMKLDEPPLDATPAIAGIFI